MKSKGKHSGAKLPKGAYRLPNGNYITESRHDVGGRRITIRAVHRDPPDYEKLAEALLWLAEDLARREKNRGL